MFGPVSSEGGGAGVDPEDRTLLTSVFLGVKVTVLFECGKHAQPRRPRMRGRSWGGAGMGHCVES